MKIYRTILIALLGSYAFHGQAQKLSGVFREVDLKHKKITYLEFKADSVVILKKINLKIADTIEKKLEAHGRWKITKDTIILNFDKGMPQDSQYYENELEVKLLIKDNNALYSHRHQNGKFVKDGILRKAHKFLKMRPNLLFEYYNVPN